jgi:hypothetical protein
VVNIDNGAGAGALAALIAHKVSKALKESEEIKRDNRDTLL